MNVAHKKQSIKWHDSVQDCNKQVYPIINGVKTNTQMASMNTTEINSRINELEFQLQFQEDTIESLNQALSNQQQTLMQLQQQVILLAKQLESYRQQQPIQDGDLPPHY